MHSAINLTELSSRWTEIIMYVYIFVWCLYAFINAPIRQNVWSWLQPTRSINIKYVRNIKYEYYCCFHSMILKNIMKENYGCFCTRIVWHSDDRSCWLANAFISTDWSIVVIRCHHTDSDFLQINTPFCGIFPPSPPPSVPLISQQVSKNLLLTQMLWIAIAEEKS